MEPLLNSVLVSVTEACHVGCEHCGFIGATRNREADPLEMNEWVRQVGAYGVGMVIFTGGEPFERFKVLASGVSTARDAGMTVGIFTSSFWAVSFAAARKLLGALPGTTRLYLSTDVYHQRRVPFQNVRNAIDAALELGIPRISLMITFATDEDRSLVASEYAAYGDRVELLADRVIPNPKFSPDLLVHQDPLLGFRPDMYATRCFLGTPMLNPNGDLFSCHVGKAAAHRDLRHLPYFLGSLREQTFLEIMSSARRRPDYQFLRTHGPKGIAQIVQANPNVAHAVGCSLFTNGCDMCMSVLKTKEGAEALRRYAGESLDTIDLRLVLLLEEQPAFHPSSSFSNSCTKETSSTKENEYA